MNRLNTFLIALLLLLVHKANAQEGYVVRTTRQVNTTESEEQLFTIKNFPYYPICDWKAGQSFMLIPEDKYGFMATLKASTTDRDVNNSKLQYKILEFKGMKEVERKSHTSGGVTTQFIFESEGEQYYHEIKNSALAEICAANPRAAIYNLVYLGDVDIARELLSEKTLYTKFTSARIDDANNNNGYREVTIPRNLEVKVTAIGAGTRECPVKIVFEDKEGNSYYRNVIFSRTNSGLIESDMVGVNYDKSFAHAFSLTNQETKSTEEVRNKYVGQPVYPKRTIEVIKADGSILSLPRYTPLIIKSLTPSGTSTIATLKLSDRSGTVYTITTDLHYDVFLRNENYINDMFGYADLRKLHPNTSESTWDMISKGEVSIGMTKAECKLTLGEPIQIVKQAHSRYESWYYRGRTLEFEKEHLVRMK